MDNELRKALSHNAVQAYRNGDRNAHQVRKIRRLGRNLDPRQQMTLGVLLALNLMYMSAAFSLPRR